MSSNKIVVVFAASGTGGHLFPAQAAAQALVKEMPLVHVHFAGKGLNTNPNFDKEFDFSDVDAGPITKNVLQAGASLYRLGKGTVQSVKLLLKLRPKLVIGFGSFHSVPVLAAAALLGIPYILHESNSIPGRVTRLFSKRALWTGLFFQDAAKYIRGKTIEVDIPLRRALMQENITQKEARRYYGLDEDKKTILIFGGSQGAKSINELIKDSLPLLPKNIQFIHFTGKYDVGLAEQYQAHGIAAYVKEFERNIHRAWIAADAVISRSGAVTIAEALFFQKPLFCIPYPYAQDNHQEYNAKWVEECLRGGMYLRQSELTKFLFVNELRAFLVSDSLQRMRENMQVCACAKSGEFLRNIKAIVEV